MDKKIITEQKLLKELDAYAAHADELAELVEAEVDLGLDEVEEEGSHE